MTREAWDKDGRIALFFQEPEGKRPYLTGNGRDDKGRKIKMAVWEKNEEGVVSRRFRIEYEDGKDVWSELHENYQEKDTHPAFKSAFTDPYDDKKQLALWYQVAKTDQKRYLSGNIQPYREKSFKNTGQSAKAAVEHIEEPLEDDDIPF